MYFFCYKNKGTETFFSRINIKYALSNIAILLFFSGSLHRTLLLNESYWTNIAIHELAHNSYIKCRKPVFNKVGLAELKDHWV